MNAKQAKLLMPGTVVSWDKNPSNLGFVTHVGPTAFFVDWAAPAIGKPKQIRFTQAQKVSLYAN